jgi:hypothetical protein
LEGGRYRPLSDEDVQRIHEAALAVLARTGVEVVASECRDIFEAVGARVDKGRDRVYLSRELVEGSLKQANRDVVLYSQDGRTDLHLRGKRVHLGRLPVAHNPDGFRVRIRNLPARTVAYIRVLDPYRGDTVVAATQRQISWAERHALADGQWLGYQWEKPEITALEN